jgi:hypothetical protein
MFGTRPQDFFMAPPSLNEKMFFARNPDAQREIFQRSKPQIFPQVLSPVSGPSVFPSDNSPPGGQPLRTSKEIFLPNAQAPLVKSRWFGPSEMPAIDKSKYRGK